MEKCHMHMLAALIIGLLVGIAAHYYYCARISDVKVQNYGKVE